MPVKPVPSATAGVVVGEDLASCVAGSVVAVEEDAVGCLGAAGALPEGLSPEYTSCSPSRLSSAPPSPVSLYVALPSGVNKCNSLKAAPRVPRESSSSPLKSTEGTGTSGSGLPAGLGFVASLAGATVGAVV